MNEVSIIINGVRYDSVDIPDRKKGDCDGCDLSSVCKSVVLLNFCIQTAGWYRHFKKSDKSFEP